MNFIAEIKSVSQTKRNLDNTYKVCLETSDPMTMDLGKLSPDKTVNVSIEMEE